MAKKLTFILIIIIGLVITGFLFKKDLANLWQNNSKTELSSYSLETLKEEVKIIQDNISLPGPLRLENESATAGSLTIAGVIAETNEQRQVNGEKPLTKSSFLNKAALLKLDDMFEKQYFAHESPLGEGPSDLARKANYDFIIIGENLALGNFESESALLEAWMNSPGHRENILHKGYTQIGVAVRRGKFEGKMTWLAVQEFGTPAKICAKPSTELSQTVEKQNAELAQEEMILKQTKQVLNAYEPKTGENYNNKIREYNNLVERYNAFASALKDNIQNYNQMANNYNDCLATYSE